MKKILLVGINARYTHTNLALRYLRNLTPVDKYQTILQEYTINQPLLEILASIASYKPDILAFSVYIWNTILIRKLLPELHKLLPNTKIILGGPDAGFQADLWLEEFPYIDNIVRGAGETAWQKLIENDFQVQEKLIQQPEMYISTIPFPYQKDEFPQLQHRYIYYEASRGCPFKCSYCLSSRSDQKLFYRDLELVKQELAEFCKNNVKIVKFVDRSFNADHQFSRNIWNYLSTIDTKTKFHFEIHPELLQQEDLDILSKVPDDRFQLEIGIQSIDNQVLSSINRFTRWNSIKEKILQLTQMGNLHIHVDLIVGLPYETSASLTNAFNEVYKLEADHFQLGFLKILPGTEMAERIDEFEIQHISEPPYEVLCTKWLSFTEIDDLRKLAHLLDVFYNSGHFKTTLSEMIQLSGSPEKIFKGLNEFLTTNSVTEIKKNWQNNGKILISFVGELFPDKEEFLKDCLRWDWCRFASAHYYPDFLLNKLLSEIKHTGRNVIRENHSSSIPKRDVNRAIFFGASDSLFADKYLPDNEIAVFIKGKIVLKIPAIS